MKKHILARQNGNAIQYVQVTRTGGTKITTDPQKATLFDSVASAERQKNHAPKKLKEYQIYESGILHEEISSDKKEQPVLQQPGIQSGGMDHEENFSVEPKEIPVKNIIKRKNLPQSTRITVYNKAEGRCAICGDFVPYDDFTIDHIEPLSKGGDNEPENLQCTCRFCNFLKGNLPDQEFMDKVTDIVLVRAGKDKGFRKKLRKKFKKLP